MVGMEERGIFHPATGIAGSCCAARGARDDPARPVQNADRGRDMQASQAILFPEGPPLEPVVSLDVDGIAVSLLRGPATLLLPETQAMAFVTFVPQVVPLRVASGRGSSVMRPARMRSLGLCFAPPGAQREVTLGVGAELVQVGLGTTRFAALVRRSGVGRASALSAFEDRRDPAVAQIGPELRRTLIAGEAGDPAAQGIPGGRSYMRCLAEALLLRCLHPALQAGRAEPDRLSVQALARVDRLMAAAVEHGSSTVREMALAAGLSPAHFSRAYKATTGESPHQALLRRRVERGCELLRTSRLRIAEIAARTGFASQAHFTSTFKRIVGITPASFRRRHSSLAPADS